MNTRESEGIEDRWERRAELSAESPGRKTRHHRKIALSRTHLFSIPSSWPFTLSPSPPLLLPRTFSGGVLRVSLASPANRFFRPTAYIQIRVSSVSFVLLGSLDPSFSLPQLDTHARSTFCKTRDLPLGETTAFLPSNGESIRRVNFER